MLSCARMISIRFQGTISAADAAPLACFRSEAGRIVVQKTPADAGVGSDEAEDAGAQGTTVMLLRTSVTPFTVRASSAARLFSCWDLAKPDNWTMPPWIVFTLMSNAEVSGSFASLALTCAVTTEPSTYSPTDSCLLATEHPTRVMVARPATTENAI